MSNRVISTTGAYTGYTAAVTIDGSADYFLMQQGGGYVKINRNTVLGVSGTPADISTSQSFTNKTLDNTNTVTLKDTLFTLQDDGDTTKQAKFQLSGITTATTRTYTLPNASSTLADIATAQTFTNKTLTSPAITGGTIANATITVNAIGEFTAANGVTIDGMNIKDGKLNTNNSVVTANITDTAVTPAKLQAGTGTGWSWATYVPTYTNFSLGNGTVNYALWNQTGKTVRVRVGVTLGSTSTVTGAVSVSLPVTSSSSYAVNAKSPLGTAMMIDSSSGTGYFTGYVMWSTTTTILLVPNTASSTYTFQTTMSSTIPMTWATDDGFYIDFTFEAA